MPKEPQADRPDQPGDGVRSVPGLTAAMAVAMGVGPLIVYSISTVSPFLVPELGLSRTQYGTLATVTFAAAALASLSAGKVVDRTGVRQVMWWLVFGALGAMLAAAAAPGYWVLLLAVVASGVVQALSNPVTNRLAAQWVPLGRRGLVMGIKQSGVQMTQAGAGLVLPSVALLAGWRGAMALAAATTLLLGVVLVWRYVPKEDRIRRDRSTAITSSLPPSVWWLAGYIFLIGAALQGVNFYLPLFGFEELGLPVGRAGMLAAVIGSIGVAARIGWGRLSERLGGRPAMLIVSLGGAGAMALILASVSVHPWLVWVGAVLLGATGVAANVVVMVSLLHTVQPEAIGRASGMVALGMYLGFTTGPVSVGALVDALGHYSPAWAALIIVYLLAAGTVIGHHRFTRSP